MKQTLPNLRHLECEDFLQLARVIKAARFFIGNQSFPYAVAEALKVPRILEVCPEVPDVIPTGGNTGEAFFQPNFEKLVRRFWAQTAPPSRTA
jgi:ADP-heptose:LPS heptosyltransferase